MSLASQLREQIENATSNLEGFVGDFGNGLPELYQNLIIGFSLLEAGLITQDDLIQALTNEINTRFQTDTQLSENINLLNQRIDNIVSDPIPNSSTLDGLRIRVSEFFEILSEDQVDGLTQRLSIFTNALAGKLSDLIASVGTGITIDKSNPAFPVITQNRPLWDNIQNKPVGIQLTNQKGQANGYPSLDSNAKIPLSQLPSIDSALIIVNNIAERNQIVPTGNLTVFVRNATGDPTVTTGWATYLYDFANTTWIKKSEGESLDLNIVLSWINLLEKPTEFNPTPHGHTIANISGLQAILDNISNPDWSIVQNKPTTFTPSTHSHIINDITGLQAALNGKRNTGNIPAAEITESTTRRFATDLEKQKWNNVALVGAVSGSTTVDLANRRVARFLLSGNLTITAINNLPQDDPCVFYFRQDGTGNRTITLPATVKIKSGETPDLGANKKSILTIYNDGVEILGSWNKGW